MLVELNIQMNILWLQNKQLQCSEIRSAKPCEMSHDNREDQCKATSVNAINTGLLHRFGNILRQQLSIKEVGRPQQKSQQAFFMENLWEEGWVLPLGTKSSSLLDSLQQLETTASAACVLHVRLWGGLCIRINLLSCAAHDRNRDSNGEVTGSHWDGLKLKQRRGKARISGSPKVSLIPFRWCKK